MRIAEAEQAAEFRREEAAQERREANLREIARRAEQTRASLLEEQYRRDARQEIISSACEQAQIAETAADYRGERPGSSTRSLLAACSLPSAADRWERVVVILPEARAEWQVRAEAETATWERAGRVEAELRRAEAVRQRRAKIEAKSQADKLAADQLRQAEDEEVGLLERVATTLPAPLVQLVRQVIEKLEAIPTQIALRAAYVNQRAQSGAVTALALAEKIPPGIRAGGEEAMIEFIDTRHVSHIQSVYNNPARAADPSNLIWENAQLNRVRGPKDISAFELLRAHADNATEALKVGGPRILAKTGQGCVIGAVMELPVAAAEHRPAILDGNIVVDQELLNAAKSVAATGVVGCALTAAAAGASGVGILALGTPMLIPIAVAGGSISVVMTSTRIWNSLSDQEQAALLGKLDVSREVVGELSGSAWAAAQDGGAVVAAAIQETADAAGWWVQSDRSAEESVDGN